MGIEGFSLDLLLPSFSRELDDDGGIFESAG